MERASKVIRGLRLPVGTLSPEELACAAWPAAVGAYVASHTRAVRLVRERLVVEVEDKTWQKQLMALTMQVQRNLERALGPGLIDEFEFRIVPRRREPQRATAAVPALPLDEADTIPDPTLRRMYRVSRSKARA